MPPSRNEKKSPSAGTGIVVGSRRGTAADSPSPPLLCRFEDYLNPIRLEALQQQQQQQRQQQQQQLRSSSSTTAAERWLSLEEFEMSMEDCLVVAAAAAVCDDEDDDDDDDDDDGDDHNRHRLASRERNQAAAVRYAPQQEAGLLQCRRPVRLTTKQQQQQQRLCSNSGEQQQAQQPSITGLVEESLTDPSRRAVRLRMRRGVALSDDETDRCRGRMSSGDDGGNGCGGRDNSNNDSDQDEDERRISGSNSGGGGGCGAGGGGGNRSKDTYRCYCGARSAPPHRSWELRDLLAAEQKRERREEEQRREEPPIRVEWVDLCQAGSGGGGGNWRQERRQQRQQEEKKTTTSDERSSSLLLPTAASMVHLLRSLLGTSHSSSPWCRDDDDDDDDNDEHCVGIDDGNADEERGTAAAAAAADDDAIPPPVGRAADCVVLLLPAAAAGTRDLERFRVNDVCPSWVLHSVCSVKSPLLLRQKQNRQSPRLQETASSAAAAAASAFVYRRLPARERLSARHFRTRQPVPVAGCLWEAVQVQQQPQLHSQQQEWKFRVVSPPYISVAHEYPAAVQGLLDPSAVAAMTAEAARIGRWTAWPEREHYGSQPVVSSDNNDNNDNDNDNDNDDGGSAYVPWKVFPLCYCFPACDADRLTWVPSTCAACPDTVRLLREHAGPHLRTALFSRLSAGSVLEAHTGWADLANHVARLHVPLIADGAGLCGAWVDGVVETHRAGRAACFDDSKTHRAFNYSSADRIVLIVDLARPARLPAGTAAGGHSEELDAFIEQMTSGGGG